MIAAYTAAVITARETYRTENHCQSCGAFVPLSIRHRAGRTCRDCRQGT